MTRLEICLSDEQAEAVGRIATASGVSSSEVLRRSVVSYAQDHDREERRRERLRAVLRGMEIQDEMRHTAGSWDAIAALRVLRESRFTARSVVEIENSNEADRSVPAPAGLDTV